MVFYKKWWFLTLGIILIVLFFPKECGTIIPSKVLDYKCYGFNSTLLSKLSSSNTHIWCSGICLEKSIKTTKENNKTQKAEDTPSFLIGVAEPFKKALIPLALIFLIIGVIQWIQSMQRTKKTEIKVIRGPG